MTILDLKKGDFFEIEGVTLGREIGKRLADMGFTSGTQGQVIRYALLADPLQVQIMGYSLSIRRVEAAGIQVKKIILPEALA